VIWVVIGLLAVLSATFSGSETALFKLDEGQRKSASPVVAKLLDEPRALLVSILLANLVVNLLFFSITPRAIEQSTGAGAVTAGFVALVMLLVCGEIVPKALALRAPVGVAKATSVPIAVTVKALGPVRTFVQATLELARTFIGENERVERGVTPEVLEEVLQHSRNEGVLGAKDVDLLGEIVELEHLRVREAMTPRVDLLMYDLDAEDPAAERARVLDEARRNRITWVPVMRGHADDIAGSLGVRDLLVHADRPPESLVMPVKFVPEVARLLALLSSFHLDRVSEAIVVDEWGGTAGVVTLEDVFEELVGDMRVEGEEKAEEVVGVGEGQYRVSGSLSVRDWNENFGLDVVPAAFETVGGFVTATLGRLPRAGDKVDFGAGLTGVVDEVRGHRVVTLTLSGHSEDRVAIRQGGRGRDGE